MIEFFMAMNPPTVTAQEHKVTVINGKPVFYDPPDVKDAKLKLCGYLAKHKPKKKIESGCRLVTKWCFPNGRHKDGEYRITKPDTDNLQKLLNEYIVNATHRWNIKSGAVRSGKSYVDTAFVIPFRIRERAGKPGLNVILGVSKESIERNVLQPMREIYTDKLIGTINNRTRTGQMYLWEQCSFGNTERNGMEKPKSRQRRPYSSQQG